MTNKYDSELRHQERGRVRDRAAAALKSIEGRKARLRDIYELGDIKREDYMRRRESLDGEAMALRAADRQTFRTQRAALRSLVDD